MAKQKLQPQAAAPNAAYTPAPGDFEFLNRHDLQIDTNFASQSYWKGVFTHFFKNRRAVAGLVIITVIILLAVFGPIMNSFGYRDIVQYRIYASMSFAQTAAALGISESSAKVIFYRAKKKLQEELKNEHTM